MSQTHALYRLQTVDLDLEAQRVRLRTIKQQLNEDEVVQQARADVANLEAKLRPAEAHVNDLNLEIQTVTTQSQQFNDRLYGGKVSNPKELQDLQDKIGELKHRREKLENQLLEDMIEVEELQASLAEAQTALEAVSQSHADEHAALRSEGLGLQSSIKALKIDRETALQDVDPETLSLYQTMRSQKQGRVVAPLEGDACSACRVSQTTTLVQRVRQGQEMIACSNCQRILIAL